MLVYLGCELSSFFFFLFEILLRPIFITEEETSHVFNRRQKNEANILCTVAKVSQEMSTHDILYDIYGKHYHGPYHAIKHMVSTHRRTGSLQSLRKAYDSKGFERIFSAAISDYVEYLVAVIAGKAIGVQISPPLHVDVLWHMHILNTELYRNLALDELVLSAYNRVATETHLIAETSLTNIDHSTFDLDGRGDCKILWHSTS